MTGFGEITGRAFREFTALNAYRWDIIGSILGTLAFTFVAFMRSPSWIWPLVTLVALWALYGPLLPWVSRIAMVAVVGILITRKKARRTIGDIEESKYLLEFFSDTEPEPAQFRR